MEKFISRKIISLTKPKITPDRFPYLTIASNVFLGFAFGRIMVMPAEELAESISIKVFLIIGTCLFFNYLLCTRKAAKGVTCTCSGKIRPFLGQLLLFAAINAFMLLLSLGLFFLKSLS